MHLRNYITIIAIKQKTLKKPIFCKNNVISSSSLKETRNNLGVLHTYKTHRNKVKVVQLKILLQGGYAKLGEAQRFLF